MWKTKPIIARIATMRLAKRLTWLTTYMLVCYEITSYPSALHKSGLRSCPVVRTILVFLTFFLVRSVYIYCTKCKDESLEKELDMYMCGNRRFIYSRCTGATRAVILTRA